MQNDLTISVLGAIALNGRNGELEFPGGRIEKAVLGHLALNANRVLPVSAIQEAVWPGDRPETSRKMIQNAVSRIRRVIAGNAAPTQNIQLVTRAPGYLLRIDNGAVDLNVFRSMVNSARELLEDGDAVVARDRLRRALDLWRGEALADLVEAGFACPELAAVEDERLTAMEDYFDAELACDRFREMTPGLERAIAQAPLRERLRRQHMIALYRSGRQAEALATFRELREALVTAYGIEPGPSLQAHHRMILRHDPALLRSAARGRVERGSANAS
ncbi:AfsR/SARP family transcriptional regulator [Gordonia soli]|uniref:Putative AfsR family transcriptional regulator n=1 Tax=Gordonia soli NBRC 108243 TaxID=1223545 RepID=M0QGZ0_9ACTN|nr:AfsR/SARP family transcriptional regulator [Gordonia soli]GAC67875.1 putative AfsR family transcriptional regulator [Gordonia soli NBRC 108243]